MKTKDHSADSSNEPRRSRQVPEQYLGYSLQTVRFLTLLLTLPPSASVSLEVFEDVGSDDATSNQRLASQVKSALVKNPISDRATDLWKTFANWLEAIGDGTLDLDTTRFEIYLAHPRSGNIAKSFSDAESADGAARAIKQAREILFSSPKSFGRTSELKRHIDRVFAAPTEILQQLVMRFQLVSASEDAITDLRPIMAAKLVPPESAEDLILHAEGWVKDRVDKCIQARKPATIAVHDFHAEMTAYLRRINYRGLLTSVAPNPLPSEIAAQRFRLYVQQLQLIDCSEEDTIEAINAYLRASVDRSKWAEEGIVHAQSFTDFTEALLGYWRNKRRQFSISYAGLQAIKRGELLLLDCQIHKETLEGLELPAYFVPGSYHALADDMQLGWHPDYETMLSVHK